MRYVGVRVILAVILALAILSGAYVWLSRGNPYVFQVAIGSILFGLLFSTMSALVHQYVEKSFKNRTGILFILVLCLLVPVVAWLVWFSNAPPTIREEIPVVYLVDPKTCDLVLRPHGTISDTGSICHFQACMILKEYRSKTPGPNDLIAKLVAKPYGQLDPPGTWSFFENLTEYLVAYYIGHPFTTGDTEPTRYWREAPNWLGWPDPSIRGTPQGLKDIGGQFDENLFYGLQGHSIHRWDFRLPKGASMVLRREEDSGASRFTIKNEYLRIDIGVCFLVHPSFNFALVSEPSLEPPWRALRQFHTRVYYNVTYSKWRYGYPQMRHYERWANDLLAGLQWKFSWGSPSLVDDEEVMRYFDSLSKLQEGSAPN